MHSLLHAGFDPDALAASGLTPVQAADVVGRVSTELQVVQDTLAEAERAQTDLRAAIGALDTRLHGGQSTDSDVLAKSALDATLRDVEHTLDSLFQSIENFATENLTTDQIVTLSRLRRNAKWRVPLRFRAADRTDDDWRLLIDASTKCRSDASGDQAAHETAVAVVNSWESDPQVVAAQVRFSSGQSEVRSAWRQAVSRACTP